MLAALDVRGRGGALRRGHAGRRSSTALQPDVLVKGADWPADRIVGRDTVEARGGRVVRVTVEEGYSTTALVEESAIAGSTAGQLVLDRRLDLRHDAAA